jgi:hypothetical protein
MSEDLLDALAGDLRPRLVRRVGPRLGLAVAAGCALTFAGVLILLRLRPDMSAAAAAPMFWMKLAYPLVVALVATACMERLSRPVGGARGRAVWLVLPPLAMAVAAIAQLAMWPPSTHAELVMGGSALVCPWLIMACSVPVFGALVWAVRGLAPTRLRAAGAMAGLAAGASGATLYALHCAEPGGAFVLLWYSLGMLAPAAAGALLGPPLLRWR